jgi:hypothetical protein
MRNKFLQPIFFQWMEKTIHNLRIASIGEVDNHASCERSFRKYGQKEYAGDDRF